MELAQKEYNNESTITNDNSPYLYSFIYPARDTLNAQGLSYKGPSRQKPKKYYPEP